MKKLTIEKQIEALTKELSDSLNRWRDLNVNGGSDPFYADGVNMNLVRNHIIYYKRKIQELCTQANLPCPAICDNPTPSEVDNDYMACTDEIRASAQQTLAHYKADPDFSYLAQVAYNITDEAKKSQAISLLNYVNYLGKSITANDLITMRRYKRPGWLLKSVRELTATLQEKDFCGQQSFLGLIA